MDNYTDPRMPIGSLADARDRAQERIAALAGATGVTPRAAATLAAEYEAIGLRPLDQQPTRTPARFSVKNRLIASTSASTQKAGLLKTSFISNSARVYS